LTLTLADDRIRVPAGIQPGERFGDIAIVPIRRHLRGRARPGSPRSERRLTAASAWLEHSQAAESTVPRSFQGSTVATPE
jgi:hypothetical protein